MTVTRAALHGLKLAQLKQVAVRCGIPSSGTKTVLAARVVDGLAEEEGGGSRCTRVGKKGGGERIVSIDMGIRNLAYCCIEVPAPACSSSSTPRRPPLQVRAWTCTSVSAKPATATAATATAATATAATTTKESFEPATYAQHAYSFLAGVLRQHAPTRVLIERQRYRSMGAAAVQEWTVRVNMFEGMLHAVLQTLAREKRWPGEVQSVLPAKVAAFWIESSERGKRKTKKGEGEEEVESATAATTRKRTKTKAKARAKAAKVDLVARWLQRRAPAVNGDVDNDDDNHPVAFTSPHAAAMAAGYAAKWTNGKARAGLGGARNRSRKTAASKAAAVDEGQQQQDAEPEEIAKLDDLADCLLQAVAWVRWQQNRRALRTSGLSAFVLHADSPEKAAAVVGPQSLPDLLEDNNSVDSASACLLTSACLFEINRKSAAGWLASSVRTCQMLGVHLADGVAAEVCKAWVWQALDDPAAARAVASAGAANRCSCVRCQAQARRAVRVDDHGRDHYGRPRARVDGLRPALCALEALLSEPGVGLHRGSATTLASAAAAWTTTMTASLSSSSRPASSVSRISIARII
ncbi:MAG: hypothetical protein M1826_005811 [Phylliscum demangeonii]|nr:MAG: hypothetical protein M1826_005811 [Phylliscum demangeonii]